MGAKLEFYDQMILSFKDAVKLDLLNCGPRIDELFVRIEFIPYFFEGFNSFFFFIITICFKEKY